MSSDTCDTVESDYYSDENEEFLNKYLDDKFNDLPDRIIRLKKLKEKKRDVPKLPKYRNPMPPDLYEAFKTECALDDATSFYKNDLFKDITSIPHLTHNYMEQLIAYKVCLVFFYRKWCYPSLYLLPRYLRVAYAIKVKLSGQCTLALCDVDDQKALMKKANAYGTPTLALYVDGVLRKNYSDKREEADLKKIMLKAYDEYILPRKKLKKK